MKQDTSRSTVLVITVGFLALHFLFAWPWAAPAALVVGLAGVISRSLSRIIEKGWMKLTRILSYIIPSILLGIVFYLVLFPIALISRIFNKDPLMLSKRHQTYFVKVDRQVDRKSFEKIW